MKPLLNFLHSLSKTIISCQTEGLCRLFKSQLPMGLIWGMGLMGGWTGWAQSFDGAWPEGGIVFYAARLAPGLPGLVFRPDFRDPRNAFLIGNSETDFVEDAEPIVFETDRLLSFLESGGKLGNQIKIQSEYNLSIFLNHWGEFFYLNEDGHWAMTHLGRRAFFELDRFQLWALIRALKNEMLTDSDIEAVRMEPMEKIIFEDILILMESFIVQLIDNPLDHLVIEWFFKWDNIERLDDFFTKRNGCILLTDNGKRWFLALTGDQRSYLLECFIKYRNIPRNLKSHLMNLLEGEGY